MPRSTHTYAVLEISTPAFEDIRLKLARAGYEHAFKQDEGRLVIDMQGIAVAATGDPETP